MYSWNSLRRDHGWAALQFQSVLRTKLLIPDTGSETTPIRIDLIQGTDYAFVPIRSPGTPIKWYMGDIYDFSSSPSGSRDTKITSNFARQLSLEPGEYRVLVRAMYEIRMFGDPGIGNIPTINLSFRATLDEGREFEVVKGLRVVPHVVKGILMGDWLSVPIRLRDGNSSVLTVMDVEVEGALRDHVRVRMPSGPIDIQAGQIRPIPLQVVQSSAIAIKKGQTLDLKFHIIHGGHYFSLDFSHTLTIHHDIDAPFTFTFASPLEPLQGQEPALVSYAVAVPPKDNRPADSSLPPVMLALHGAGVDVENGFWAQAMPKIAGLWAVLPTGKNEWGEDWHGGSMDDAWAARDALPGILRKIGLESSDQTLYAFLSPCIETGGG
jgi:hypothetical protein